MSHAAQRCYAVVSQEETRGNRFTEIELRSSIPEVVAGSSFAFTWDFDYHDYKVGSTKSERQVRGPGYYPVMHCPSRGKKKLLAAFTVPSFPYLKETTVQEDKCARFL